MLQFPLASVILFAEYDGIDTIKLCIRRLQNPLVA